MLIDSVLIWLTRGSCWRNRQELAQVKQGLSEANTEIIPITPRICSCASNLIDDYALSDGLRLADALIAATAIEMNLTLLTANTKHFSVINRLKIDHFDPAL